MATNRYDYIVVAEDFQSIPLRQNLSSLVSSSLQRERGLDYTVKNPNDSTDRPILAPRQVPQQSVSFYELDSKQQQSVNFSALQQLQQQSINFTQLSPKECISEYSTFFLSKHRNLVLVTDSASSANGSLLAFGFYKANRGETARRQLSWMYNSTYQFQSYKYPDPSRDLLANADDWRPIDGGPRIKSCLSETTPEACSLQFSFVIISIIIICNIGKMLIMAYTAFKMIWQPLITVGDGIASFLVEPDTTTKNALLLKIEDLGASSWFQFMRTSKKTRWFRSFTLRRWLICNALYAYPIFPRY